MRPATNDPLVSCIEGREYPLYACKAEVILAPSLVSAKLALTRSRPPDLLREAAVAHCRIEGLHFLMIRLSDARSRVSVRFT